MTVKEAKPVIQPYSMFEEITPAKAEAYLQRNKCNRSFRKGFADKISRDMESGRYRLTHQGIGFDVEGNLIDGQHRLMAIVQSGVTIRMQVTRNLPVEANEGIDQGIGRTAIDILHYKGFTLKKTDVAIAKMLMPMKRPTLNEVADKYLEHQKAISAISAMFPTAKRHISIAVLMTPMVRAFYTHDAERLARFAQIMYEGIVDPNRPGEFSALLLRDFLMTTKVVTGEAVVTEIYGKVQRALAAFLKGERLTKLYQAAGELFQLPETKTNE